MAFFCIHMAKNLSEKCWYNVLAEELDGAELTKKDKTKLKLKTKPNGEENEE